MRTPVLNRKTPHRNRDMKIHFLSDGAGQISACQGFTRIAAITQREKWWDVNPVINGRTIPEISVTIPNVRDEARMRSAVREAIHRDHLTMVHSFKMLGLLLRLSNSAVDPWREEACAILDAIYTPPVIVR